MAVSTDAAAADAAKRKADADAAKAKVEAEAEGDANVSQRPVGPGQIPTPTPRVPEEAAPVRGAAGEDNPPLVVDDVPDPRVREAHRESRRQAAESGGEDVPDERLREPMDGAPDDVAELLGDSAKASGRLRMASVDGARKRLQAEWVAGGRAAWFDVPEVTVEDLEDVRQPVQDDTDAWEGTPGSRRTSGSRRPSREA